MAETIKDLVRKQLAQQVGLKDAFEIAKEVAKMRPKGASLASVKNALRELDPEIKVVHGPNGKLYGVNRSSGVPVLPVPSGATIQKPDFDTLLNQKHRELRGKGPERNDAEEEVRQPERETPGRGIPVTGGRTYYARELAGRVDYEVLREAREMGIFAALSGDPGTGKTVLALAAFGDELYTVAGTEETQLADFVGQNYQDGNGNWFWVDGPLVTAMRKGAVILIDDITVINPRLLALLYPLMDGRGELAIPRVVDGHPEIVKAAPGFYMIAAHNPGTHGAIWTAALSSRFGLQIEVPSDYKLAAMLGVPDVFTRTASILKSKAEEPWYPNFRELEIARDLAEKYDLAFAARNLVQVAPYDSRATVIDVLRQVMGVPVFPLRLGEQAGA